MRTMVTQVNTLVAIEITQKHDLRNAINFAIVNHIPGYFPSFYDLSLAPHLPKISSPRTLNDITTDLPQRYGSTRHRSA